MGGFCEQYTGYGGEDTDFAATATRSGVDLWWVGGAEAYHQHHPVHTPPSTTSTTSCATALSTRSVGAHGRCSAGCASSPAWASSSTTPPPTRGDGPALGSDTAGRSRCGPGPDPTL
ncbi:glycosyltransferase family 2 protein [Streptomyces zhihengii]